MGPLFQIFLLYLPQATTQRLSKNACSIGYIERVPGKRVAVLQSNYIPWKGYFDIIHDVDVFVFYDDVQYSKNDWRNRNRIKTPRGVEWLTIPVGSRIHRLICEVELPDQSWVSDHLETLSRSYAAAPFFEHYREFLSGIFLGNDWRKLSDLNQALIRAIARDALDIPTEFRDSREFSLEGHKQDRLLDLLVAIGCDVYVSGRAGRNYLDVEDFERRGIEVQWKDYAGYPEYPQLHPPFVHEVTVLDVLFHTGRAAPDFIWRWREGLLL